MLVRLMLKKGEKAVVVVVGIPYMFYPSNYRSSTKNRQQNGGSGGGVFHDGES